MSVDSRRDPPDGKTGSWATILNVEPTPVDKEPPAVVKNPHPLLIGVFVAFFIAIVAMVVAIAVLKAPAA